MKFQMKVDDVLVADYYNYAKAVDHTLTALEDERFSSVTLTKVQDNGEPFAAVDAPLIHEPGEPAEPMHEDAPAAEPQIDPNTGLPVVQ